MEARDVAARMTTFMVLLYSVYMGSLLIGGVGLYTGIIPGGGSFAMTIVPAIFGGVVIALVAAAQLVKPGEHRLQSWLSPIGDGVRDARRLIQRGNLGLLGAIMWWAFDIACLWACFKAFGDSPAVGVLVIGYFVGMLANTLPLPGGVGGVDGGMIGMFVAFGVNPATAIVAVLAYRFFAFWLPIAPGRACPTRRCAARSRAGRPRTRARTPAPAKRRSARPRGQASRPLALPPVQLSPWKVSAASSTTQTSSGGCRRWPSRCRPLSRWRGRTTRSSWRST